MAAQVFPKAFLKVRHRREDLTPDLFVGQHREEPLNEVGPRRAGRREVQEHAPSLAWLNGLEPGANNAVSASGSGSAPASRQASSSRARAASQPRSWASAKRATVSRQAAFAPGVEQRLEGASIRIGGEQLRHAADAQQPRRVARERLRHAASVLM